MPDLLGCLILVSDIFVGWPLHSASYRGRVGQVARLIRAGDDLEGRDSEPQQRTALHYAAYSGHVDAARLLLDAGAETEAKVGGYGRDKGRTALGMAAAHHHADVVRLLVVEAGADVEARGDDGRTPLLLLAASSSKGGGAEAAKVLLEAGASLDVKDGYERHYNSSTVVHGVFFWSL